MTERKERPILFLGEMVRAILDGRKTQTRRAIVPQPDAPLSRIEDTDLWTYTLCDREWRCPYGVPGSSLWVRETWVAVHDVYERAKGGVEHSTYLEYACDGKRRNWKCDCSTNFKSLNPNLIPDAEDNFLEKIKRPSIHMPRWASRIDLLIKNIRVERVQDISEEGAVAEGIEPKELNHVVGARYRFCQLWNDLNAKRGYGWEVNPWVWVIEFEHVKGAN